jgi:hypothetical protein
VRWSLRGAWSVGADKQHMSDCTRPLPETAPPLPNRNVPKPCDGRLALVTEPRRAGAPLGSADHRAGLPPAQPGRYHVSRKVATSAPEGERPPSARRNLSRSCGPWVTRPPGPASKTSWRRPSVRSCPGPGV